MNKMGEKIAERRKDLGLTQTDFADHLHVTRQTVSRWEAGAVLPDIDKITDIADFLEVSCDYLLKDELTDPNATSTGAGRLVAALVGQTVKIQFFEEEGDYALMATACKVTDVDGSWMTVEVTNRKETLTKTIPISSVLSFEIVKEG